MCFQKRKVFTINDHSFKLNSYTWTPLHPFNWLIFKNHVQPDSIKWTIIYAGIDYYYYIYQPLVFDHALNNIGKLHKKVSYTSHPLILLSSSERAWNEPSRVIKVTSQVTLTNLIVQFPARLGLWRGRRSLWVSIMLTIF